MNNISSYTGNNYSSHNYEIAQKDQKQGAHLDPIKDLPFEIWKRIFSFTDKKELMNMRLTCKILQLYSKDSFELYKLEKTKPYTFWLIKKGYKPEHKKAVFYHESFIHPLRNFVLDVDKSMNKEDFMILADLYLKKEINTNSKIFNFCIAKDRIYQGRKQIESGEKTEIIYEEGIPKIKEKEKEKNNTQINFLESDFILQIDDPEETRIKQQCVIS